MPFCCTSESDRAEAMTVMLLMLAALLTRIRLISRWRV